VVITKKDTREMIVYEEYAEIPLRTWEELARWYAEQLKKANKNE